MNFTDDDIVIEPGHFCRDFQTCDYSVRGQHLFHERTFHQKIYGKGGLLWRLLHAKSQEERERIACAADPQQQWFDFVASQSEVEFIAAKHGGRARECFYQPGLYFLAFDDTDKALAFCRTDDFDRLCLTMEKIT